MDHPAKVKKTSTKARIPDHLRRRALISCDRCKKRRIRCLRTPGADASEPCQNCVEASVGCQSTLPRKTRIYGSVETLSARYRVLEALVKGLHPDQDTNNLETLYAIADARNITLPDVSEQPIAEDVFRNPPRDSNPASPDRASLHERGTSVVSRDEDIPTPTSAKVSEEKLVPLPKGPSHYIGPSSSFGFVLTVRKMVAEFITLSKPFHHDDDRAKVSSDFAGSNWSKALEPINKEESDESSEDRSEAGDSVGARRMPNQRFPTTAPVKIPRSVATGSKSKKILFLTLLPAKETTNAFVEAYFERVHPNYLLFHRETFQAKYEAMWGRPSTLLRDTQPGWICCIFMMIVFGAQALEERDKAQSLQIQRHYLDLVQSRMHQLLSATCLDNCQAILLLQLYQHNCTERNSAFMLLGCASRMAMALGMHREGTSGGFDELEREVRKRVWWTAYAFEKNQCMILGRPCAIDDAEVNVSYPNELLLDGGMLVPPGYVEHSIRLTKLMSDVRRKIYAYPITPNKTDEFPKISIAVQLLLELEAWHNSLPPVLRLDCTSHTPRLRRAVLLLHIQYHHTQVLVARPYILRKVAVQLARHLGKHVRSHDLDKEEIEMSHSCGTFARKAADLLHQLIVTGMFDGVVWLDAYYIFHSVFILALDFLARPGSEIDTLEDRARKKVVRDLKTSMQNLKLCPTFIVLTQVGFQLSKIVGIFDTQQPAVTAPETFRQYVAPQMPQTVYNFARPGQQFAVENVVSSWFQKDAVDMPWDIRDFFGGDGYVDPMTHHYADPRMPMVNPYTNQLSGIGEDEDMAIGLPPNMGYTQWGNVETPFAPQNAGPQGGVYKNEMAP